MRPVKHRHPYQDGYEDGRLVYADKAARRKNAALDLSGLGWSHQDIAFAVGESEKWVERALSQGSIPEKWIGAIRRVVAGERKKHVAHSLGYKSTSSLEQAIFDLAWQMATEQERQDHRIWEREFLAAALARFDAAPPQGRPASTA